MQFLFGGIVWLLLWQVVSMVVGKTYLIPSPINIIEAFFMLAETREFYFSVSATMLRVIFGMIFSFVCGTVSVFLAYISPFLRRQFGGLVSILKSTPVMAVVLYVVLWMPSSKVPVFVCFLMCYPVVYTNMITGLDAMNQEYLELCRVYKIGIKDRITKLYYPEIKPHIKSALSLVSGLAWKTVVAGEVISIPKYSMGYHLMDSKIYFETAEMFAWIATIVLLSIFFEKAIKGALQWI